MIYSHTDIEEGAEMANNNETIIGDDVCYVCGEGFSATRQKTMHHTIPRHLKPQKNVVVPICKECHDKVTASDMGAVLNFAYKIMKQNIDQSSQVSELIALIRENNDVQRGKNDS